MNNRVLIVDDNRMNIRLLSEILEDEGYVVFGVDNGLCTLEACKSFKPDIILLDIMMPKIDGFQVCKLLKESSEFSDIPVIMVTAKLEGTDVRKALELGAFDYIKKPVEENEVLARIQSALKFKINQDKLKEMAMKDGLTGTYNHTLLVELFQKEFEKSKRNKKNLSFAMIDIDFFKKINDTYGHLAGDEVLREVSKILLESVRTSDIVGRYGGEEFGIVFPEANKDEIYDICERIRSNIESVNFIIFNEKKIKVTISIGICSIIINRDIESEEIIKRADEALYNAKRNGRNRIEVC